MFPASSVFHLDRVYSRAASLGQAAHDAMRLTEQDVKLASGIKAGVYLATDLDKIFESDANKERFFSNSTVQRKLVKALMIGNDLDKRIIIELTTRTPCITEDDQKTFEQKFPWMMDTLQFQPGHAIALRFFTKIAPEAQCYLANALHERPNTTANDAKHQRHTLIFTDEEAQKLASKYNAFVNKEIAKNLSIFEDVGAQKIIAKILDKKALGSQIEIDGIKCFPVLDKAIENLHHLTDTDAQKTIVHAILDTIAKKNLGVDKLVEIADKITAFDAEVQQPVIDAISESIFAVKGTDDAAVRQEIIANTNTALSALTDPAAKKIVMRYVATKLADQKDWLADASVQSFFAQAIQDGMLDDPAVIGTMVNHLPASIDDASVHSLFQSALHYQSALFSQEIKTVLHQKLNTIQQAETNDGIFVRDMLRGVAAAASAGIAYWIFG